MWAAYVHNMLRDMIGFSGDMNRIIVWAETWPMPLSWLLIHMYIVICITHKNAPEFATLCFNFTLHSIQNIAHRYTALAHSNHLGHIIHMWYISKLSVYLKIIFSRYWISTIPHSFYPSFLLLFLPSSFPIPTDLIWRKGNPFEATTGCTAFMDRLLGEVSLGFPQP